MRSLLIREARKDRGTLLRRRCRIAAAAVCLGSFVASALAANCPTTANSVHVVWENQRLTLCTPGAPVSAVLRQIARKTGVRVVGLDRPLGVISIQLEAVPPELAFPRLLQKLDYIVVGDLSLKHGTPLIWIHGQSRSSTNTQLLPNFASNSERAPAEEISADTEDEVQNTEVQNFVGAGDDEGQTESDPTAKFAKLQDSIQQWDEQGLAAAIKDSDPVLQGNAHEALKAMDPEAAEKALFEALSSDDVSTRVQALQLLQQSQPNDTRSYISAFEKALTDSDAQVRMAAVQGLMHLGGPEEMSFVRQAVKDSDPAVRLMVISGAGSQDRSLLTTALDDPDEAVRGAAAELLKEIQSSGK